MNTFSKTAAATLQFLKNKGILIVSLAILMFFYKNLPENQPLPFAELLYAVILILSVSVMAPLLRLLGFPEAARYAESGDMEKDMEANRSTEKLKHYRIFTIICYIVSLACVSGLLS